MLNTGLTDVNYTTLLCNGYPAYFMFVFDDNGIIFNCQVLSLGFSCFCTVLVFILHTMY